MLIYYLYLAVLFFFGKKPLYFEIYETFVKVDVGQLEGAFIMGLGLWTSEQLKYHPTTGELLTKNTWVFYFSVYNCETIMNRNY